MKETTALGNLGQAQLFSLLQELAERDLGAEDLDQGLDRRPFGRQVQRYPGQLLFGLDLLQTESDDGIVDSGGRDAELPRDFTRGDGELPFPLSRLRH